MTSFTSRIYSSAEGGEGQKTSCSVDVMSLKMGKNRFTFMAATHQTLLSIHTILVGESSITSEAGRKSTEFAYTPLLVWLLSGNCFVLDNSKVRRLLVTSSKTSLLSSKKE